MSHTIEHFDPGKESDLLECVTNNDLIFLPENLEADALEYVYPESTSDLRKIFRANNLSAFYLCSDKPMLRARKSADWFGPTLFINYAILTENPDLISISLNLISSYLYDFFKGSPNNKNVKFEIVIQNKKEKGFQKIKYEGNIEGIKELSGIIKQLKK
ncbi:hypothetical protein ACNQF7_01445 [Flavobacterium sp. RSP29]|uniref:hypothetical protein n=1 Tax=Flavobacterium sp. RSP29 TaxID=3401731 RepID=UPI003AAD8705